MDRYVYINKDGLEILVSDDLEMLQDVADRIGGEVKKIEVK